MSAVVAVQNVHDAWPVADVETRPGAHARHEARVDAPRDDENVSSGHDAHTPLELAPTTDDHVPAGQALQRVAFVAA